MQQVVHPVINSSNSQQQQQVHQPQAFYQQFIPTQDMTAPQNIPIRRQHRQGTRRRQTLQEA